MSTPVKTHTSQERVRRTINSSPYISCWVYTHPTYLAGYTLTLIYIYLGTSKTNAGGIFMLNFKDRIFKQEIFPILNLSEVGLVLV